MFSRIVSMIVSVNGIQHETPILILRTCIKQTDDSNQYKFILLTRFAKKYNPDSMSNILQMNIDKIINKVFVIKSVHELFENISTKCNLITDCPLLSANWYRETYDCSMDYINGITNQHSKYANVKNKK